MRQWLRSHLTYANVMATLAVFLVLGGGTALGAYVVSSNSQIGPNTVSGHKPPTDTHANIIGGSINGTDLATSAVTGPKIAANAVTGAKVLNDSLTRDDINEATLSGVTPGGTAGGDLTGTYPNPSVADGAIGTGKFSSTIPAVRATSNSSTVSVKIPATTGTTTTAVPWNAERYDTANLHSTSTDTSRLTAPVAGIYRVSASVLWDPAQGGNRVLAIEKNGENPDFGNAVIETDPPGGSAGRQQLSVELRLDAGDYVEAAVRQFSAGDLGLFPEFLTMSWVAPG